MASFELQLNNLVVVDLRITMMHRYVKRGITSVDKSCPYFNASVRMSLEQEAKVASI